MDPYEWIASGFRYYGFDLTWSALIVLGLFAIDLVAFVLSRAIAQRP